MALWTVHGTGRPAAEEVVGSGERLSWPLTVGFGVQHLFAMLSSTILVPLLTGFPPMTTLLLSGLGTLVFLLVTRNRVPSCVGASLSFVGPLGAAATKGGASPAALLGGIVVVGLVLVAVGIAVKALGVRLLESAMPPVVTGAVVLMLGLSLAPHAASSFEIQPGPALLTLVTAAVAAVLGRGLLARGAVLLAVLVGWGFAALAGDLDPARVEALQRAPWFGSPEVVTPELSMTAVPFLLPMVVVLVAEHVGNLKAVAALTGRNLDSSVGDVLIGGGLVTTASGASGGAALTTYASNVGVMAVTRVYSTAACACAAVAAVLLSFSPKLGALVDTVPLGVLGGATLVLFGVLALIGVRIWSEAGVDFTDPVNLAVVGTALIAGAGNLTVWIGALQITGLVWGSAGIVLLHPLLRTLADAVAAQRSS